MEVANEDLKIEFDDDRAMVLETAEAFCRDKSPIAFVRDHLGPDTAFQSDLWQEIAELGWTGLVIPEDYGGVGLGMAEAVSVMEPMGRALMGLPYISTTLVAGAVLRAGTEEQKQDYLPRIAAGAVTTCALSEAHSDWALDNLTVTGTRTGDEIELQGGKTFVLDVDVAEILLLSFSLDGVPTLAVCDAGLVSSYQRETVIDETRRAFRVNLDGVRLPQSALLLSENTTMAFDYLHLAGALLTAAELSGGMAAAITLTTEYLNTRRQFDRFIGAYQGLKHPMADILTEYEGTRSLLYHAASIFDDPASAAEREVAVRMVKAYGSDAFTHAADRAIQFHGAFGFTYDCDAQLYLRRALWCQSQFGDAPYHRAKLQGLLL